MVALLDISVPQIDVLLYDYARISKQRTFMQGHDNPQNTYKHLHENDIAECP
jgi:hypothetical protein